MNRFFSTQVIATLVIVWALCGPTGCSSPPASPGASVLTSFEALNLIVTPIARDIEVQSLLREGVSPHAYAPRPSEMVALRRANLVVYAHPYVDGWMTGLGAASDVALFRDPTRMRVSDTTVDTEHHEDAHGENADPHRWNDPRAVIEALPALTSALCDVFSDNCPAMRRRAAVFASSLSVLADSLHNMARASAHAGHCVVTAQPFMDQFLSRFDIPFVGPLSVSADVEPSPASLSRVIREANERGCHRLIVQSALENRLEYRLAEEQGWEVVEVDPLGWGASTYQHYLTNLFTVAIGQEQAPVAPLSDSPVPTP
jgi:ABC-type Zn uptake system ZnuABC Zn-binding protein ZnuA